MELSIRRLPLFVLLVVLASLAMSASGQAPSITGNRIDLPVLAAGDRFYRVGLNILPDTHPVELQLSDGEELEGSNHSATSQFRNNMLSIPSIIAGGVDYFASFSLVSPQPMRFRLLEVGQNASVTAASRVQALSLFNSELATGVVEVRCALCHSSTGIAASSALRFETGGLNSALNNLSAIETLLNSRSDGKDYILSKVSGNNHSGGNQLPNGSSEYNSLSRILDLLALASTTTGTASVVDPGVPPTGQQLDFLTGVTLNSARQTLRRAALRIAGRLPSEQELNAVGEAAGDSALRSALLALMSGPGFHEFLVEGANDRLLVRGVREEDLLEDCLFCYPNYANRKADLLLADIAKGEDEGVESLRFINGVNKGLVEAPLELIAYVVENNLPYREILTANYTLLNPSANYALGGTASFNDASNPVEFQPGRYNSVYSPSEDARYEEIEAIESERVLDPGPLKVNYPHAGILNSHAFLARYPTTATNRNRARARWTFNHFLGIDIEKSAPRTTDPIALADTNNPTLFNQNCTVCHESLDPVAGTFQNYSASGSYRAEFGGEDSLDEFYKEPEDGSPTLYQPGDSWYRDMRAPGYNNAVAPVAETSLSWLAERIVEQPGFAIATIKFWWPAVFGTEVLEAPLLSSDPDYSAKLAAYSAQNEAIQNLAEKFRLNGENLRETLADMMLSPWFRAVAPGSGTLSQAQHAAHTVAEFGSEKLLTPERLQRKTAAVTGFNWNAYLNEDYGGLDTGFGDIYRLYYGGINSASVTERARHITPLMVTVAMSHALESACPIVLKEFALPSTSRRLFFGIDSSVTPETDAEAIKRKLVELHAAMLGQDLALSAPEITAAYQLFVDSWSARKASGQDAALGGEAERCDYRLDVNFFSGTPIEQQALRRVVDEDGFAFYEFNESVIEEYLAPHLSDPLYTKQAWVTVITYLMTHYHYIYE